MIELCDVMPQTDEIMPGTFMSSHTRRIPPVWRIDPEKREEARIIHRLDWLDTLNVLHIMMWEADV